MTRRTCAWLLAGAPTAAIAETIGQVREKIVRTALDPLAEDTIYSIARRDECDATGLEVGAIP